MHKIQIAIFITFSILFVTFSCTNLWAMSGNDCAKRGGLVVNTLAGGGCVQGKNVGDIVGTNCPCICCVGERKVDCAKSTPKILHPCITKAHELHFELGLPSALKTSVKKIRLSLSAKGWSDGVSVDIKSGQKQVVVSVPENMRAYRLEKIEAATYEFTDVPLMDCSQRAPILVSSCD